MPYKARSFRQNNKDKGLSEGKRGRVERDQQNQRSKEKNKEQSPKRMKMEDIIAEGYLGHTTYHRRVYIALAYILRFKEPTENEWGPCIQEMTKELKCDKRTVARVWESLVDTQDVESAVEASYRCGRPGKIQRNNPGLVAAAAALNLGVSPQQATIVCNAINERRMDKAVTICKNTLLATLNRHTKVMCNSVLRRKTGNRDVESKWAKARLARCVMTKEMFQLGAALENGSTTWEAIRQIDLLPLYLDGIVFSDQSHMRAVPAGGTGQNGSMSKHQWRVAVDAETGALKHSGVVPERKYQLNVKFDSHSQGCYAVCMPTINGTPSPMFLESFDYTGKKMVSMKDWKKVFNEKLDYVRKAKGGGWAQYTGKNPFLERYGTDSQRADDETGDEFILEHSPDPHAQYEVLQHEWYQQLRKSIKYVCVRDFVLHLIVHSQQVYNGTARQDTFMIWHDRLLILWDEVSQAWLSSLKCAIPAWPERTWADRFVRIRGKFNEQVCKYYQNALPGDSPELMPLDCNLFNDIKEGVSRNVAFSFFLNDEDPDKYSLRTPKLAFQAIQKTIKSGCPSSARVREDIEKIVGTLDRIIESNGGYIEDKSIRRHGVREEAEREDRINSVDPAVMTKFLQRFEQMENGAGVMFNYSETPPLVSLEEVDVVQEEEPGGEQQQ